MFIVNKSGGLIYHKSLSKKKKSKEPQISTNDWLRIGSTFHSLHAIATEASPVRSNNNGGDSSSAPEDDGIKVIESTALTLYCLQTRTGVKFVITVDPGTLYTDQVLRELYVLYAECTLKDPFYELEMPIRCELFTKAVDALMTRYSSKTMGGSSSAGRLRYNGS